MSLHEPVSRPGTRAGSVIAYGWSFAARCFLRSAYNSEARLMRKGRPWCSS
jgi:hypothetical protein